MTIHILPGDSLAEQFPKSIEGEKIICRECLIVGDLQGETLSEFWQMRAAFIENEYGEKGYLEKTVSEFQKLEEFEKNDEINLWFEYELFCQVNLWFCLYLLREKGFTNIFVVYPIFPEESEIWKGFGQHLSANLVDCFARRVELSESDIELGSKLWKCYKTNDLEGLRELSAVKSVSFPTLKIVCEAEIDRKTNQRVEKSIKKIIGSGAKTFADVFTQFQQLEGVYGFGDSQLKKIYDELTRK